MTQRNVDGRAGERQTGAWVSDVSYVERLGDSGEMLIDFGAMLGVPDGMAFNAPGDLDALEGSGVLNTVFGTSLVDREAIEARQRRIDALRGLAERLDSRNIMFGFNEYGLSDEDEDFLDYVAGVLAGQRDRRVRIEGFTDALGEMDYNRRLGGARANAVTGYLMKRGVRRDQMEIVGVGADYAVADNATEEGRAANRRVEISIIPSQTARR
jgi:outer membrane protein OmpA-like peptidoglycan-associated protein